MGCTASDATFTSRETGTRVEWIAMSISKSAFASLYDEHKLRLVGSPASKSELDENYRYYTALAEFCDNDGELLFRVNGQNSVTWEFALKS